MTLTKFLVTYARMTQENITVPLPKKTARFFEKEAKRLTKESGEYVSRAYLMREVLKSHVEGQAEECPPTQSEKTPATSR